MFTGRQIKMSQDVRLGHPRDVQKGSIEEVAGDILDTFWRPIHDGCDEEPCLWKGDNHQLAQPHCDYCS